MDIVKTIGIILFHKKNKDIFFLLMHHQSAYWNFPKGRKEDRDGGEIDTAYREVEEETGITREQIRIFEGFRESYIYTFQDPFDKKIVTKNAIFFLGETVTEDVQISHEHQGYGWFTFKEELKKLPHQDSTGIFL